MNYHFITDDRFILPGIRHIISVLALRASFYKAHEGHRLFAPQPGDVVCIIVNNVHLRSRLLRNPVLARCRLMVMLDVPLTVSPLTYFPWILPKNLSIKAFTNIIQKAPRSCVWRKDVSRSTLALFEELCNGKSAASISGESRNAIKAIYRIKRNVFHEYGLLNCNSVGILLCRDILSMKVPI